jgi:hypothetical protein
MAAIGVDQQTGVSSRSPANRRRRSSTINRAIIDPGRRRAESLIEHAR